VHILHVVFQTSATKGINRGTSPIINMTASLKAREYIKRVKEHVKAFFDFSDFSGMQPAFAYAGNCTFSRIAPLSEELLSNGISKFDVAKLPDKGTPSRGLAEWESLDIAFPKEVANAKAEGRRFIEMKEAQKEVKRILSADGACHEYIAYEAAKLSKNIDAVRYTLHIMVGAGSEDYIFMPSETLDDLFVKKTDKTFKSREEYARHIVPKDEYDDHVPNFLESMFWLIAKITKKILGSDIEDDAINRPYMAHFYDNSRAEDDRGLNVQKGEIKFQSALDRLKLYWKLATNYYQNGEKPKAFVALGHMVHLISDMHVPAHVHNDIHGPTILLGKLDSLEQWAKKKNYPHIQRGENDINIKIWDSSPLAPPSPDKSWAPENINEKIDAFVNSIVNISRQFKSVDAPGDAPGQKVAGKPLTDDECYYQASILIPLAISNSSQLIVNFIDYQERLMQEKMRS